MARPATRSSSQQSLDSQKTEETNVPSAAPESDGDPPHLVEEPTVSEPTPPKRQKKGKKAPKVTEEEEDESISQAANRVTPNLPYRGWIFELPGGCIEDIRESFNKNRPNYRYAVCSVLRNVGPDGEDKDPNTILKGYLEFMLPTRQSTLRKIVGDRVIIGFRRQTTKETALSFIKDPFTLEGPFQWGDLGPNVPLHDTNPSDLISRRINQQKAMADERNKKKEELEHIAAEATSPLATHRPKRTIQKASNVEVEAPPSKHNRPRRYLGNKENEPGHENMRSPIMRPIMIAPPPTAVPPITGQNLVPILYQLSSSIYEGTAKGDLFDDPSPIVDMDQLHIAQSELRMKREAVLYAVDRLLLLDKKIAAQQDVLMRQQSAMMREHEHDDELEQESALEAPTVISDTLPNPNLMPTLHSPY